MIIIEMYVHSSNVAAESSINNENCLNAYNHEGGIRKYYMIIQYTNSAYIVCWLRGSGSEGDILIDIMYISSHKAYAKWHRSAEA